VFQAGTSFVATSAYYYTVRGIGLATADTWAGPLSDIARAAEAFCGQPWSNYARGSYASSYCFSAAYIVALLRAYGIRANSTQVLGSLAW
jgi:hypothetical protein